VEDKKDFEEFEVKEEKKIMGMSEKDYCMILHLSQFATWLVPILGIIVPIFLWLSKKDESKLVDEHGRNIVNWIISSFIYTVISILLLFVFLGFIFIPILMILNFIFIIKGSYKASKGKTWSYPLSIKFFKI
jgi:uncharacterized Tic20 family protein